MHSNIQIIQSILSFTFSACRWLWSISFFYSVRFENFPMKNFSYFGFNSGRGISKIRSVLTVMMKIYGETNRERKILPILKFFFFSLERFLYIRSDGETWDYCHLHAAGHHTRYMALNYHPLWLQSYSMHSDHNRDNWIMKTIVYRQNWVITIKLSDKILGGAIVLDLIWRIKKKKIIPIFFIFILNSSFEIAWWTFPSI